VSTSSDKKTSANYQSHLGIAKTWTGDGGTIRWTAGVNNLWNAALLDQVRVNAFGGRYFDPAPGRTVFMGLNYKR
jgi:iron complex outermembrane receptor protein